jgi:hypothetical protein
MRVLVLVPREPKTLKTKGEGTTSNDLQQIKNRASKYSTGCILRNNDVHSRYLYNSLPLHQNRSFIFT